MQKKKRQILAAACGRGNLEKEIKILSAAKMVGTPISITLQVKFSLLKILNLALTNIEKFLITAYMSKLLFL